MAWALWCGFTWFSHGDGLLRLPSVADREGVGRNGLEKLGFSPWPSPTSSSPLSNPFSPRSPPSCGISHRRKKGPARFYSAPQLEGFPPLPPNRIAALPAEQATHTHSPAFQGSYGAGDPAGGERSGGGRIIQCVCSAPCSAGRGASPPCSRGSSSRSLPSGLLPSYSSRPPTAWRSPPRASPASPSSSSPSSGMRSSSRGSPSGALVAPRASGRSAAPTPSSSTSSARSPPDAAATAATPTGSRTPAAASSCAPTAATSPSAPCSTLIRPGRPPPGGPALKIVETGSTCAALPAPVPPSGGSHGTYCCRFLQQQ
jgi:hypothetical protein